MSFQFEWDSRKAKANEEKHGISFEEAATVFNDERSLTMFDYTHSHDEDRFIDLGRSKNGTLPIVVYTERKDKIRLIHARKANKEERKFYEESK
jgi:hypothetical protein